MKYILLFCNLTLLGIIGYAQPSNDDCVNAIRLCAGQPLSGTTTGATASATEDYDQCPFPQATTWYMFTTNSTGGPATVSFSNMTFNTDPAYGQEIEAIFFSASTPCDKNSYSINSMCDFSGTDFSVSTIVDLAANTTYYIMVNARFSAPQTNPAECDYNIEISGPSVDATFPTVTISATDTVLCQGDDETVTVDIADCQGTSTYNWYYNDTLIASADTNGFSTTMLSNSGYLKLILDCGDLCIYSDTTDSILYDVTPISANAGPDKFIADGDIVVLDGSGDGTPEWTPGNTLTSTTDFTPSASPSESTTYFLTVTNGSCVETDSVNVFVGEVVTIYSSFSPNGDNINDKWVIRNSSQYPNMEVTVYDRSGQKVFQTTGYSTQDKWWDGTNKKGKPLPVTTYFYVVDLKNGSGRDGIFKGQVNIIR